LAISSSQLANRRGIYLGRRSARIHAALYRRTGGRIGGHLPGLPAARIVLVDHVGAKTGVRRTSPLIYHEAAGVVAVVASKAGQPTHPGWFYNLVAHPETTLQLGSEVRAVRARVAGDEGARALVAEALGGLSRIRLLPAPCQGPEDPGRDPGASRRNVASDQGRAVSMVGTAALIGAAAARQTAISCEG
jgi:F420H(2)-dependent quinone reductase